MTSKPIVSISSAFCTVSIPSLRKPMKFEFEPKVAALHMRLPQALLDAIKARAKAEGIPYTRYVRHVLEQALAS